MEISCHCQNRIQVCWQPVATCSFITLWLTPDVLCSALFAYSVAEVQNLSLANKLVFTTPCSLYAWKWAAKSCITDIRLSSDIRFYRWSVIISSSARFLCICWLALNFSPSSYTSLSVTFIWEMLWCSSSPCCLVILYPHGTNRYKSTSIKIGLSFQTTFYNPWISSIISVQPLFKKLRYLSRHLHEWINLANE